MAPHDWAFVIGIAVMGVVELTAAVTAWRARARRAGGGRAASSGAAGRLEGSIRSA